jgi:hypothetical protein
MLCGVRIVGPDGFQSVRVVGCHGLLLSIKMEERDAADGGTPFPVLIIRRTKSDYNWDGARWGDSSISEKRIVVK